LRGFEVSLIIIKRGTEIMSDFFIALAFFAGWIILRKYVFPRIGIGP